MALTRKGAPFVMQELCLLCGAHKTRTTPYHPESDGLVERFNRTLLMMLAMFAGENKDDWDYLLPAVMMAYRFSVHESTGFSPYRLMFGEECMLPMDIGLPCRDPEPPDTVSSLFAIGDWVMRYYPAAKKCKLDSVWVGPYLVTSFIGWAVGIQKHPDSPVLLIHCQDVKKVPQPSGVMSWIKTNQWVLPRFPCWVLVLWPTLPRVLPLLMSYCRMRGLSWRMSIPWDVCEPQQDLRRVVGL